MGKREKLISISITLFVIFLVIFSGPASAVKIAMETPTGQHYSDQAVTFTVDVSFQNKDLIPIDDITITGLPDGSKLTFKEDGTISGDYTKGPTVRNRHRIRVHNCYGYGYGYDENPGYGYGYSQDNPISTYEITISGLTPGNYSGTAIINVNTGDKKKPSFSSTQDYSFEIISRAGENGRHSYKGIGGAGNTNIKNTVKGTSVSTGSSQTNSDTVIDEEEPSSTTTTAKGCKSAPMAKHRMDR